MFLKNIALLLFLNAVAVDIFAQSDAGEKKYVDYDGKSSPGKFAPFYIETIKTDKADPQWIRRMYYNDTIPGIIASIGPCKDEMGQIKEGAYLYYYKNGAKKTAGSFFNNLKDGEWNEWDKTGKLENINHYSKGIKVGRNISWHSNNTISDSTILDENGNGKSFSFYEDGSKQGEGNYTKGVKNGQWLFYYQEAKNQQSMEINFELDSAVSYTCYDEEGKIQKKDCVFEREANFRGGEDGWKKYLVKKLTAKWDKYTKFLKQKQVYNVIVRFVINKDGSITDVKVENKGNRDVDEIAVDIIQNSPDWIPAVQYNRKVKAYRRQPITFVGAD